MLVFVAVALCGSGTSHADLAGSYAAGQQRAGQLQRSIQADGKLIQSYEGRIGNLEAELTVIEQSVETQERLLNQVRGAGKRARATALLGRAVRARAARARRSARRRL
jgi:hypothetical protein